MMLLLKILSVLFSLMMLFSSVFVLTTIWGELIRDWKCFHSVSSNWDLILMTLVMIFGTLIIILLLMYLMYLNTSLFKFI